MKDVSVYVFSVEVIHRGILKYIHIYTYFITVRCGNSLFVVVKLQFMW